MSEDTWLVIGLGNPGAEYATTRHNAGYFVLDELASRMGAHLKRHKRANAEAAEGRLGGQRVVLGRSRTYMNESGGPVKALMDFYRITPERLIVIHDELDIDPGALRVKLGGGDGGHNGLKSIRRSIGTGDFTRVRFGIGRPPGRQDAASFVLKPFSAEQRRELPLLVVEAADAVESVMTVGIAETQNKFNR